MKQFETKALLNELTSNVQQIQSIVEKEFLCLTPALLLQAPEPGRWSIAQCLEHLNTYNRYYIPALEKAILHGQKQGAIAKTVFRSGWLGNYFTRLMQPRIDDQKAARFQAQKNYKPSVDLNTHAVLDEFLAHQQQLLILLRRAEYIDIERYKVSVSIAKWVKMSVGDTFRFLIAHEQRHILQAERVKETFAAMKQNEFTH